MTDSSGDKRDARLGGQAAMRGYLFEQFVAELLSQLGFSDLRLAGPGLDQGIDILATYPSIQPTGEQVPQLWAVQVKHLSSRLGAADIAQLSGMFQVKGADKALLVTSSNLTSAARAYLTKFQNQLGHRLEIWDRDRLVSLLTRFPGLLEKYKGLVSEFPLSAATPAESKYTQLIEQLGNITAGKTAWRDYERLGITVLTEVFVPPLKPPREQARTWSGLERRDALFSLCGIKGGWQELREEFDANFLRCEFKNYTERFGKDEVNQTRNYLKRTIGRLGVIFSRNGPDSGAIKMRNSVFGEERKVILFYQDTHLRELLRLKSTGQDSVDLLQDAIDEFYVSYE